MRKLDIIGLFGLLVLFYHCTTILPTGRQSTPSERISQLYTNGEYDAVINSTDTLITQFPQSSRLKYYRGLAFLQTTELEAAMESYQAAKNIQQNQYMDSLYAATLVEQANQYYQQDQFEVTKTWADSAIAIEESNTNAYYAKFMADGRQLLADGSEWALWDAVVAFGNAAQMKPENPMPHYYMAQSYHKKDDQDFDNIISEYETALELNPPENIQEDIRKSLEEARRRKKIYDDFWGN